MRETMRLDMTGIKAAQKTTSAANEFLSTAETGLANISRLLIGDIHSDDNGLIKLIYDTTLPSDMRTQQINDILNMIDGTARSTNYNGKRMLDGSMSLEGALFQLGKDVQDSMQYRMAMPNMTLTNLGGESGKLYELRTIDLDTDAGKAQAYAIVNEAVNMVARQRGIIGAVQKHVLESNSTNLDVQLEKVSEAEGLISNVDMALESARLNRSELLAQSAMRSILYSRNFAFYIAQWLL
jgi:flagellin